jgi:hypothetical protein
MRFIHSGIMKQTLTATACTLVLMVLLCTGIMSCSGPRKTASNRNTTKVLLAENTRPGLRYELYLLPADSTAQRSKQQVPYARLSLRIVNTADNASPLRRICRNLDEYNTYYEYLLNGAPGDLQFIDGKETFYPVSYSFENNYNAFPFETINAGFRYDFRRSRRKNAPLQLLYADRVFARDTLVFHLNLTKQ